MKVYFCSTFLENEAEVIRNSKTKPSVATHKFNINLIEGLRENIGKELIVLNTENTASYPNYNKIIQKTNKREKENIGKYLNIGKVNLPILKYISETILLYSTLKKNIKNEPDVYVCGYGRHFSHVVALNLLKRKNKNINTCMVLADLGGTALSIKEKTHALKQIMHGKMVEFQVNQSKKIDSFVLLTEAMAPFLGIENKPYTIVEGICSNEYEDVKENMLVDQNKKIISYSGVLSRQYGVDVLIEAFKKIENEDYNLWLFGDGEMKDEITKLSKNCTNIHFFGFIPNNELRIKLAESTVLVNPRQNLEIFTKYSFPSKTIEYLTLAKPLVAYKLDGIPSEYKDYIFYVDDNEAETLKNKLIEVCELPIEELHEIGRKNFDFVTQSKSSVIQTKKILNMFESIRKDR